jgi:O-antigen/teichoic acid export membrane protein
MVRSAALSVWAFAVPAVTSFVTAPILANGLGPHAFAIYALALAYAGTASAFGLGRAVMRELSRPDRGATDITRGDVVSAGLWLGVAVGLALATLLAWSADALVQAAGTGDAADALVLRIAAFGALPTTVAGVALAVPQGLGEWRQFARLSVAGAIVTSVGGAAVAWSGAGAVAVVAWTTTISTGVALAAVRLARRLTAPVPWRPEGRAIRTLLGLGGEILGAQVVVALWALGERVLVSRALGPAALAAYVVALMLGSYLQALVVAVAQVLAPTAHRASRDQAARVQDLYAGTTLGVAALSGAGGATIAGAGAMFLALWMGPTLASAAAPALVPLGVAFALNGLTTAAWFLGEGLGHQRRNLIAVSIGATVALGGLAWLGAREEMLGAGLARLGGLALAPAYIWWMERATRPAVRAPWRSLVLVMAPASVALGVGLHLALGDADASWPRLVMSCAAGWTLFAAVIWTSGAMAPAHKARLRALVARWRPGHGQ